MLVSAFFHVPRKCEMAERTSSSRSSPSLVIMWNHCTLWRARRMHTSNDGFF
jgi:hypothetical protein